MKKENKISRGFKPMRKKLEKQAKYIATCSNCKFNVSDSSEDECINSEVTEFDMNYGDKTVCTFWKADFEGEEED